jgi:hypothetical protein
MLLAMLVAMKHCNWREQQDIRCLVLPLMLVLSHQPQVLGLFQVSPNLAGNTAKTPPVATGI